MYHGDNSMKGNIVKMLDNCASDVDDLSLALAVNSFLVVPVSFAEAFTVYASLLDICNRDDDRVCEPLYSKLHSEIRDVQAAVITEKMRNYSISIRKIIADSIASSLCRQHNTLLEHLRGAVRSNTAEELLALANGAVIIVPEINDGMGPVLYPCRA